MRWQAIWALRYNILTWVGGILTVAAALYYGPRKMLETWDWYMFRFRDRTVLDVLESRRRIGDLKAVDVAFRLGRSQSSVLRSLNRLQIAKRVAKTDHGSYYCP
jgi:hypothetical protein